MQIDNSNFFKLTSDFFKRDEIVQMGSVAEGDKYVLLYLNFLSLAAPSAGYIRPTGKFDSFEEELASLCGVGKEMLDKAFDLYGKLGLLECGDPVITGDESYAYFVDADKNSEYMGTND